MIDRAFARTFGNFSTIFVITAVVVFPLHLAYAFIFRDVIAAGDYHHAIEALSGPSRIGDVGPADLDKARLVFWILTAGELLLLPFAARATLRAFEVAGQGGISTATDAWAHAFGPKTGSLSLAAPLAPAGAGLVVAVLCGLLISAIGGVLTDFLSSDHRWVGEAFTQGMSRAGALPFFLGPLAASRAKEEGSFAPKLY